jgi:hypothetical protein
MDETREREPVRRRRWQVAGLHVRYARCAGLCVYSLLTSETARVPTLASSYKTACLPGFASGQARRIENEAETQRVFRVSAHPPELQRSSAYMKHRGA